MPELPEVETTKRSLQPLLEHTITKVAVYQPKLRWQMPDDLTSLQGYQLTGLQRRAKYLLLTFTKGQDSKDLIIHLGMSGSLQQHPLGTQKHKHDHLMIHFVDSQHKVTQLHYHDPRRFGAVLWADNYPCPCQDTPLETKQETSRTSIDKSSYRHKLLAHLGVEPLTADFSADYLYQYIHTNHKKPITRAIKSVIMEQKVVVGVGNIYATESLFMTGINPKSPANLISQEQIGALVDNIKSILAVAIDKGGSSLKDFTTGEGKTGYFQQTLLVYGRDKQPCVDCETTLENCKINQRASVYCPKCQPLLTQP